MKLRFLGQGLGQENDVPVGNVLKKSFIDERFRVFYAFVAFATEGGIARISTELGVFMERQGTQGTFYVGVDNQGTSTEALHQLLSLGVEAYVFHTLTQSVIYHPKIYVFKGELNRIVIGPPT